MLVIVKNVTASSEETKVIAEIEADLEDLVEYVLSTYMKKQRLTYTIQHSEHNPFRRQPDPSSESVAHSHFLES